MGIAIRSRRSASLAGVAALLLAGVAVGVTQGASDSQAAESATPGTVVHKEDAHGEVRVADPSVRNKRKLVDAAKKERKERQKAAGSQETAAGTTADTTGGSTGETTGGTTGGGGTGGDTGGSGGDSGGHGDQSGFPTRDQWLDSTKSSRVSPEGGAPGEISAAGSSFVKVPFMEYYAIFTDTKSDVAWLGGRPFNADSIKHTDTWRIGSVGAPFLVVGAPEGAAVKSTGSSAEASWSTSVERNWYSQHAYDQVAFYPPNEADYSNVFRISHSVTGTFQFGSSFFTVTSQDRAYS
ncbi:hypothetical protein ACGFSB_34200 [Streptomyces sp. NPDC048441]|uniref:hypothetical protein n=1 Tax=Streptomyces sp. NPDC048441 TaxID=3365552 RepID=UPI003720B3A0